MIWITLGCCLLLCLGCAQRHVPSQEESPEAFLATMQQRMQAGLEILYVAAIVDHYHAQCVEQYPTLQGPLDTAYHAFQTRHARLAAAARRYVLLPAAFAPFAEETDFGRLEALVETGLPARAGRAVTEELAEESAAARYVHCVFFAPAMRAGTYDLAQQVPAAVQLIQDAEAARTSGRRVWRHIF
jgi:hypothetical protein